MKEKTVLDWFINFNKKFLFLTSREKKIGLASNSEIRRWFKNKAIILNDIPVTGNEIMKNFYIIKKEDKMQIKSLILFPKSKYKVTIW